MWVSRRTSIDEDWGPPENPGPTVNSEKDDSMASISADGLTLYFSSDRPWGYGNFDIYKATRATPQDPWDEPANLGPVVNSPYLEACPSLSPDGLVLFFTDGFYLRPGDTVLLICVL